jgi:hypothetical protein
MKRPVSKALQVAGLALVAGMAGCGSSGNFTYRQYGNVVGQAFRSMFSSTDLPRDAPASIPYASLGYRLNGGDEALLVLATQSDQSQLWTAASHVVLQTSQGRITRTVGLAQDLGGLMPQQGPVLPALTAALAAPFASQRIADLPQINAYGVVISCNTAAAGRETITILGQAIATMRVDESCASRSLDWRFVDNYWLDEKTGFVWRSRQHLSPSGETVDTEIFRPPA